jgi:SagB-type dehydrogenase family enzyme
VDGSRTDDGGRAQGDVGPDHVAADANAYLAFNGWLQSTGFRTHGLAFKDLGAHARGIGEEFLVQTRYRRSDRETEASVQAYFVDAGTVMLSANGREDVAGLTAVALPAGVGLAGRLGELLARRRSVRHYTGEDVGLDEVATIVRAAAGINGAGRVGLDHGGERTIYFRTAPSAGGLYPLELWLLALRVRGLPRAAWRFDPRADLLVEEAGEDALTAAFDAFAVPEELMSLSRAAAVLLLVGRPWKAMRKYGQRGVRFLFVEAGAMAENVHLASGSLGLGTVDCASVCDDDLHQALGIDGELRLLVHTIVVGRPADGPREGGRD